MKSSSVRSRTTTTVRHRERADRHRGRRRCGWRIRRQDTNSVSPRLPGRFHLDVRSPGTHPRRSIRPPRTGSTAGRRSAEIWTRPGCILRRKRPFALMAARTRSGTESHCCWCRGGADQPNDPGDPLRPRRQFPGWSSSGIDAFVRDEDRLVHRVLELRELQRLRRWTWSSLFDGMEERATGRQMLDRQPDAFEQFRSDRVEFPLRADPLDQLSSLSVLFEEPTDRRFSEACHQSGIDDVLLEPDVGSRTAIDVGGGRSSRVPVSFLDRPMQPCQPSRHGQMIAIEVLSKHFSVSRPERDVPGSSSIPRLSHRASTARHPLGERSRP